MENRPIEIIAEFDGHCPSCKGSKRINVRVKEGKVISAACWECDGAGLKCARCGQNTAKYIMGLDKAETDFAIHYGRVEFVCAKCAGA